LTGTGTLDRHRHAPGRSCGRWPTTCRER